MMQPGTETRVKVKNEGSFISIASEEVILVVKNEQMFAFIMDLLIATECDNVLLGAVEAAKRECLSQR